MHQSDHESNRSDTNPVEPRPWRRGDGQGTEESEMTRRQFLGWAVAGAVMAGVGRYSWADEITGTLPYRILGRTGEKVSLVGLGGYHIGVQGDEQLSLRIIRTALDNGVNFLDNCWDYNGGVSEIRMGKALQDGYRKKAFLMTKIDGRDRKSAARQIDESLQRLQTDRIDLMQVHEVIRPTDADRVFAAGGAMEALVDARKAGKIRYIGFTGHKSPEMHLKMLDAAAAHQFTFDAVQLPLNVMDAHYESFEKKVVPVLVKNQIGVLAMKTVGGGAILRSGTVTPVECLQYAMNLPTSVVITGCDSLALLDQALKAARAFRPMSEAEVGTLLAKTVNAAKDGQFERYKTTNMFDGTTHNPSWLG